MSSGEQLQPKPAAEPVTTQRPSLLEDAIKATKQTSRSEAEVMFRELIEWANQGVVRFDKSVKRSIDEGIQWLDSQISKQLAAIMHHADFQKLEGTWRGMRYLVFNTETSRTLKIKTLHCTRDELFKDLTEATEFDQSMLFQHVYTDEFGTAGGEPMGAMIGDFEFTSHPEDIQLLSEVSKVAAGAFCPFISSVAPSMLGFDSWTELNKPRDLEKIFEAPKYIKWNSFRDSEDSRFVTLTFPRTLARLPYGAQTKKVSEFMFEEVELGHDGQPIEVSHDQYCWMNTAFVLGTRLTDAFAQSGWCTRIQGFEGGGRVEGLDTHVVETSEGDETVKCPTEVLVPDRREAELGKLGFLPLCHYKKTDYAAFFGAQTTQKPKNYGPRQPDANANAEVSARLPVMMATSRIAHYLKVMARDKIGSLKWTTPEEVTKGLESWLLDYISADSNPDENSKARYPLRAAKVEVKEDPSKPGAYQAVAWLQPWLPMQQLTTSLRMVARLPQKAG